MGEKSDLAREKIIEAFYELISIQGCKKTSFQQISEKCGMSKGHINFYFKRKVDLMITLAETTFIKSFKIISECEYVPNDELMKFLLHYLLMCYLSYKRTITYRFIAEMVESYTFIYWISNMTYNYILPGLRSNGIIVSKNVLLDSCIFANHGAYSIVYKDYTEGKPFDCIRVYTMFIKTLLSLINFSKTSFYLEESIQIFDHLDKDSLYNQFQFKYN